MFTYADRWENFCFETLYKIMIRADSVINFTSAIEKTGKGTFSEEVSKPRACIIKLITAVIYGFLNKLECLSLASFSSLV